MKLSQSAQMFLATNQEYLPEKELPIIRQRLSCLTEEQQMSALSVPMKKPIITFLLSFFFGIWGFDRFYLGQIGMGIFKLLFLGILSFFSIIGGISGFLSANLYSFLIPLLYWLAWIGYSIWIFIDIFIAFRHTKQTNLHQLNKALLLISVG